MRKLISMGLVTLLLIPAAAVARQWRVSKLKKLSLEEILDLEVTTGTKTALSLSEVPASVTVFTRQELRSMGVETLEDVLNLVPGFTAARSNQITASEGSLYVRGSYSLFGEGVLVLRDGQRLNDPSSGGGFVFTSDYPVDAFKQIEIVRGPGSALYGANAFLGVINLVTDESDIEDETEIMVKGGTHSSAYASFHYGNRVGDDLRISVDGHFSQFDLGRLELADVTQRLPTPFGILERRFEDRFARDVGEMTAIGTTVAYRDWRFVLSYQRNDNENALGLGLPSSGIYVDPLGEVHEGVDSSRLNASSTSDSYNFGLFHERKLSDAVKSHFQVFFSDYSSSFRFPLLSYQHISSPVVGEAVKGAFQGIIGSTSSLGFDGYIEYTPSDRHSFVAGLNLQRDEGRERTEAFGDRSFPAFPFIDVVLEQPRVTPTIAKVERDLVALYGEYVWSPIEELSLTAGIRGDDYSDFGSSVNPRLAAVYRPTEDFILKALFGSAFRAPNFQEAYRTLGEVLITNPQLEPEELQSYELQATLLVSDKLSLGVTGYLLEIDNAIRQVSTLNPASPQEQHFVNLGSRKANGVEAELRWAPSKRFSTYLTYDRVFASTDRVGAEERDVEGVPLSGLNLALNLNLGQGVGVNLSGSRRWDWVDQSPLGIGGLNIYDGADLEDYTILNLKLSKALQSQNLEIFLQVNNLLDEQRLFAESIAFQPAGIPTGARQALVGFRLQR